jgi:hypothetical protein
MRNLFLLLIPCLVPLFSLSAQDMPPTTVYTYANPTGNRYLPEISGSFPDATLTEIPLDGTPLWVVGGQIDNALVWVVALNGGRVVAVPMTPDGEAGFTLELAQIASGQPIAVQFGSEGLPTLLTAGDDASPQSHPLVVNAIDNTLAYISTNGDLVLWRDGNILDRIALNLQPDARPVTYTDGDQTLIATYAEATNQRYVHAIMGDDLEGASLSVLTYADNQLTPIASVDLPGQDVFEGISPFFGDLNDDGAPEIITTVSNGQVGAWIRAYTLNGEIFAESDPIGQGFRWRHQIAVGPFGINGETQLVDVRTPHIGGMPEFFDLIGDTLSVSNAQLGYTSHIINSPNLDMALAGDFDGDNKPELVLTDQQHERIIGVINTGGGVQEVWQVPLDGTLTTNLAAIVLEDGTPLLAAGTDRAVLRVWRSSSR